MDPERAARAAIDGGQLLEHRGNTEPDTSMAVAVDVQSEVAAAYVVTHVLVVEWQTDVITFARVDAAWEWRAEGGSGCGDCRSREAARTRSKDSDQSTRA